MRGGRKRGWRVVGSERDGATSKLNDLARAAEGRLEIENVDIVYPDQVAALRARLACESSVCCSSMLALAVVK
jgi:hypothetical protein